MSIDGSASYCHASGIPHPRNSNKSCVELMSMQSQKRRSIEILECDLQRLKLELFEIDRGIERYYSEARGGAELPKEGK